MPGDDRDGNRATRSSGRTDRNGERSPTEDARRRETSTTSGTDRAGERGPGGFVFDNDAGGSDDHPGVQKTEGKTERVKAALARIAGPADEAVVDRAVAAVDDLDAAVAFVERGGLADLEGAIEATADPEVQARGERALAAFRRFQAVARGRSPTDHLRRGRDTDIRGGTEAPRE